LTWSDSSAAGTIAASQGGKTMRAIFVIAIVLSTAWGLMSAAEPPRDLPKPKAAAPSPPSVPASLPPIAPQPTMPGTVGYYAPAPYVAEPYASTSYEQLQELRQHYTKLAAKRAERMDASELRQGIADMRRHALIAELTELASDSTERFDGMRAAISAMALKAKDQKELENSMQSVIKELEQSQPTDE
jgi:hypothetical protein